MFNFFKKKEEPILCGAIIAAGGMGSRMGGDGKQLIPICDMPMIARTLFAFENARGIDTVVVVCKMEEMPEISRIVADYGLTKVSEIVRGGESRMESVAKGIEALPPEYTLLAIHDGARPLVTPELIDQVVEAAKDSGAAAAAIPVVDTLRLVNGEGFGEDVDRSEFVAMQTPQAFNREQYDVAIAYALKQDKEYTDDVAVYRTLKRHVTLVTGERSNIKITTPEDIYMAEAMLEADI